MTPGDRVVVGVSGGPDSCALLRSIAGAGFAVHVAHLIHDPPEVDSRGDAEFVRDLARDRGCDCTVATANVADFQLRSGIGSFEQAARNLRYRFLAEVARDVNARIVAVGHTADDQAETILMRVARGTGLYGLRGMREVSRWPYPGDVDAPTLWRPLLELRRSDTIGYCQANDIPFRDDPTNYSANMARNRVRMNLMPALAEQLNPQIAAALVRMARTVDVQLDYLEKQADAHWSTVAPEPIGENPVLKLNRDALFQVHPALRALLLRRAWVELTGNQKRLTQRHLHRMEAMASGSKSGSVLNLPGGYEARTQGRWMELAAPSATDYCPYPALTRAFRLTLPMGPIAVAVTKQDGWEVTARVVELSPSESLDTGDPLAAYLSAVGPVGRSDGQDLAARRPHPSVGDAWHAQVAGRFHGRRGTPSVEETDSPGYRFPGHCLGGGDSDGELGGPG